MSNLITDQLKPLGTVLENIPISKKEFINRAKTFSDKQNLLTLLQMVQFNSAYKIGDDIILN